jgi:hypothetical protein
MALSAKLSGDELCIKFSQLCNVLDTRIAVAFSSKHQQRAPWRRPTASAVRALTQAPRQQLRADHEVTALWVVPHSRWGSGAARSCARGETTNKI